MEKIRFAWLDADMYNDQNQELLKDIRRIHSETMEFTDQDECQRFLGRGVGDPKRIIFIVSGRLGENLVPKIHENKNILSIYIYCAYREKHEKWSKPYAKVKVVTSPDELLTGLESDRNCHEQN